jgi:hypothetical protein
VISEDKETDAVGSAGEDLSDYVECLFLFIVVLCDEKSKMKQKKKCMFRHAKRNDDKVD